MRPAICDRYRLPRVARAATIHAICSANGLTESRKLPQRSRLEDDARDATNPMIASTTSASATSASTANPVVMTWKLICARSRLLCRGLQRLEAGFDRLNGGGGANRRWDVLGGNACRGGPDVGAADDRLGDWIRRVLELCRNLVPGQVGEQAWGVAGCVQAVQAADVDEREA